MTTNPRLALWLNCFLREGYEAAAFTKGTDALAYLDVGAPSAAVIDIHLPDMSGLAICRLIRAKLGRDLPIIIFSGDNSIETLNELAVIGIAHFFNKPVRASELLQRIREILPGVTCDCHTSGKDGELATHPSLRKVARSVAESTGYRRTLPV